MENRKIQYTKNVIRESFLALRREKPLEKISVTGLCSRADINRSTFYDHYLDVYDLNEKIQQEFFEQISSAIHGGDILEITKALQANADFCFSLFGKYGDYMFFARCISYWMKIAQQEESRGDHWRNVFVASGAATVTAQWIQEGMKDTPEEIAHILDCLLRGAYSIDF